MPISSHEVTTHKHQKSRFCPREKLLVKTSIENYSSTLSSWWPTSLNIKIFYSRVRYELKYRYTNVLLVKREMCY